jgi:type IV pilus assembly protein PilW
MRAASRHIRQAGFTLIEILIALLIGLIGIVVMMQTFAVSESFKRTATSGTDAQVNGAVALYMLEREIRMAGFGMNSLMQEGCNFIRTWNNALGTGIDLRLVPFELNPAGIPAGDANTDTFMVSYGNSDSFVQGIAADQPGPPGTPNTVNFVVVGSNRTSFKNGDRFVSVMPGAGAGGQASCVMHEVTKAPNPAGNCGTPPPNPSEIVHATGVYKSYINGCGNTNTTFNSSAGIRDAGGTLVPLVKAGQQGKIYNLGASTIKVYAIRGGNLTFCDWNSTDCTQAGNYTVVVNDIVSMRAVYGMNITPSVVSGPGDGNVTWGRAPLTGNVFLPSRVHAVSLELTARSGLKEKPSSGTTCDATPTATRPDRSQDWMYQSMAGAGINLSATSPDWACYRYKLFQTNVALRNMLWRP